MHPRDTFRLVGDPRRPRLGTRRATTRREETGPGRRGTGQSSRLSSKVPPAALCVKVYGARGVPRKAGEGIFARIFMECFPLTPVEEEGRLYDPALRENFIERIFACKRYSDIREGTGKAKRLVDFHAEHRLQLMAHSPKRLKEMDGLVARAKQIPAPGLVEGYGRLFMEAMAIKPTAARHENVLTHILGLFQRDPTASSVSLDVIRSYRGAHPLVVPVTLLPIMPEHGPPIRRTEPISIRTRQS